VKFETAAANLAKGEKRIDIELGVLRGSDIGLTFQGMLFDAENRISMTGTFMPLYGLNRIFGELPVIGQILGNGRDRGLIGITFKLFGDYRDPGIEINPISLIAPGIFRQLFEFSK